MELREIGRTGIGLSVIGFGTAQLQMLPERKAVGALRRAFELGINWVHTAPDYGGVEPWIARAIRESGLPVSIVTQSPAYRSLLEPYFENTCALFGRRTLDLYGINCIEDIERIGEDVWGPDGMIAFLQRQKANGRLRGIFCSTHGSIDYVERLVNSGVFDALMVAYNPIGFHLLSYCAENEGRQFENMADTGARLFPLAAARGVSLFIMKALGGGLLSRGKAFPSHVWPADRDDIAPGDLLRFALEQPAVACVVPGIASVEEAEEDAAAGRPPLQLSAGRRLAILDAAARMRLSLCSRCGACESTCSRGLPISSMFRDAYIWNYRNETFMADDRENYFTLHPGSTLTCVTCDNQSCLCPQGLEVPAALARIHALVGRLRAEGQHPGPLSALGSATVEGPHRVVVVTRDVSERVAPGRRGTATFLVENAGTHMWTAYSHIPDANVATAVGVVIDGRLAEKVPLRQNISPGQRSPVSLEFSVPHRIGRYDVAFVLMPLGASHMRQATRFLSVPIHVTEAG